MPADRDPPTATDYLVTAASPALVIAMVASLVFFLAEVLYAGMYPGRLLWTLFFFVLGAVLVARIAIEYDAARATAYGLGLAVVVYIALLAYVDVPSNSPLKGLAWLVNLVLMGVVWGAAHKLTWDCTFLDENREASGRGVLAAAGLGGDDGEPEEPAAGGRRRRAGDGSNLRRVKTQAGGFWGWVERYGKYREKQKAKPHTPGVWVVYFSLAALPLFGLGQSLIDPADAGRRRYAFWLMAVYVASGLGLLVSTSLLGLRRYLRQRRAKPPAALTASWLGLGAGLSAVFLVTAAFLPRPHSEVPWFGLSRAGGDKRDASKYAVMNGESGKGEETETGMDEKDDKGDAERDQGDKKGRGKRGNQKGDSKDRGTSKLMEALEKVGDYVKWLVFGLVAVVVVVALFVVFLRYLAPFTAWARNLLASLSAFWDGLWAKTPAARRETEEDDEAAPPRRRPFREFANPFDADPAGRPPAELVAYTFAAADAWAWDRGIGRAEAETPLEFALRLGQDHPLLEAPGQRLAALYARAAYSDAPLPPDTLPVLREVWEELQAAPPVGRSPL